MRRARLLALLLGELAACPLAIQNFRTEASRVGASRAEALRTEASRASRAEASRAEASRAEASRAGLSRTEAERATMESSMESSMEASMELSFRTDAAFRAHALASAELSYTSEAAFSANEFLHTSMFGHTSFDIDDMLDEDAIKAHGHASMFGVSKQGRVVEGSEKSDLELESEAEGHSGTVIKGSQEPDEDSKGDDDGDVIGAEDDHNDGANSESDTNPTNAWDPTRPVGTTLSPEQRVQAHDAKFEAEFTVELDMTEAHDTGKPIGVVLNRDADFIPATIWKIHKYGLVEDWNRAHPDMAVHVGDEVTRINDVQWHANTETFIRHIAGQFQSARSYAEGAKRTLSLYIQRPRVWKHNRFIGQREDAHKQDYAAEFVASISMPDELDDNMENTVGWQLVRQHGPDGLEDWKPVIVKYIDRLGKVEQWNKENPDKLVLEGDEIMQLDNIRFHHNATSFIKTLMKHYRSATQVHNTNRSALVYIRRPRANQEEFDATHPVKEIATWFRPKHSVQITFPQTSGDPVHILGWQMLSADRAFLKGWHADRSTQAVVIKKVRAGGLTDQINEQQPGAIEADDLITEVNGFGWEMYDKPSDFYQVVDEALKEAAKLGPKAEPVNLVLERPTKGVRKIRANMERGVHMDLKMLRHTRELRTTTTTELPPMFGSEGTAPTQSTGATHDEEVTGASDDDDDDSDVIGAGADGQEVSSDGAKDVKEQSADDTP